MASPIVAIRATVRIPRTKRLPQATVGDPVMTREPGLRTWPASARPAHPSVISLPVLIQVPALPGTERLRRVATARGRVAPARRRRLRREFRQAGTALLLATPLLAAALGFWGGRAGSRAPWGDDTGEQAAPPPRVTLRIPIEESTVQTARPESCPPIVFPGYVLPADSSEDAANAGS